jgi:hypothetical protein
VPEPAWVKAIFTPAFFNFPALLRNAVEGERQDDEALHQGLPAQGTAIDPSDHDIPQATPAPRMAPVAQTSVRRKRGSRGRRLVTGQGQANLPNFPEEAGSSGKGSGKSGHRSANVKGNQATHRRLQKLAKQSTASKHYQARARGHVKHAVFTTPTHTPLDITGLPATSTGYTARHFTQTPSEYGLSDLIGPEAKFQGFSLVEWNGRYVA